MTAKPKTRGLGKKEALVHVNLRLPKEVLAFYRKYAGVPEYTAKMRDVLTKFAVKNGVVVRN
tara:strand:- start:5749 stop:5934 length:186 start_codon:yes stop_codon:yes gene_type:complete